MILDDLGGFPLFLGQHPYKLPVRFNVQQWKSSENQVYQIEPSNFDLGV